MSQLSIHVLLHVPFEGLGCIEQWIMKNGHSVSFTLFYKNSDLPNLNEIDWVIVMGGPMGVSDEVLYPWLVKEKEFIRQAIVREKTVIGICLGSQLIAEVLGTKVYPNKQKEIGWFNVERTEEAKKLPVFGDFEDTFSVFHWHGDTYDLPAGSTQLFYSNACAHQAFLFNQKVLGLQFHFEVTSETLKQMVDNGRVELVENNFVQSSEQILKQTANIKSNNQKLFQILDYFAQHKNE